MAALMVAALTVLGGARAARHGCSLRLGRTMGTLLRLTTPTWLLCCCIKCGGHVFGPQCCSQGVLTGGLRKYIGNS